MAEQPVSEGQQALATGQSSFAHRDGVVLRWRLEGPLGASALAFVNALGTDLTIWDGVATRLADRFRILRYDKRGHGLSDAPPGEYSLEDHSADLAHLLSLTQLQHVVVVGISVGGLIAMHLAAAHAERVRALVLMDTGAKIGTTGLWEARIQTIRERGLAGVAASVLPRWFAPSYEARHPSSYRGYFNMLNRMPEAGYLGTCATLRDTDLRPLLGAIQQPALVLCGAEDAATPPELARELALGLAQGRSESIPDAGHLPCVERPDYVAERITAFLEENPHA